jgi:hypothetical protein
MVKEFPRRRDRKRLTPARQLEMLEARGAIEALGSHIVSEQKRRLKRVRIGLERIVCSSNWFDENWRGTQMIVTEKGKDVCRHVSAPYPPGGDETLMQPCKSRQCNGRLYPPNYMTSSGHCYDCQIRMSYARSRRAGNIGVERTSAVIDERAMNYARSQGNDYRGSV